MRSKSLRVGAAVLGLAAFTCRADPAPDNTILARTPVPSRLLRQGEVRLVQRGSNVVVQTVLSTRHLERVVRAILAKEVRNWPADASGASDAARYAGALQAAARSEPPTLGIDFEWGPQSARVLFYQPTVEIAPAGFEVTAMGTNTSVLAVEATYLERNQELILEDSFGREAPRVLAQLRRLRGEPPP